MVRSPAGTTPTPRTRSPPSPTSPGPPRSCGPSTPSGPVAGGGAHPLPERTAAGRTTGGNGAPPSPRPTPPGTPAASTTSWPRPRDDPALFGGPLTYSSGPWEEVDWSGFDIVGIDLYRDAENEATFVDDVGRLHRHGKPVVITEFGCCSFRGAEDLGGRASRDDWTADPRRSTRASSGRTGPGPLCRRAARHLRGRRRARRLRLHLHRARQPVLADPRFDLDMAGFGIVKCYPRHRARLRPTGHFEPKAAFETIATRYQ